MGLSIQLSLILPLSLPLSLSLSIYIYVYSLGGFGDPMMSSHPLISIQGPTPRSCRHLIKKPPVFYKVLNRDPTIFVIQN